MNKDFKTLVQQRRSHRKFTDEPVSKEHLHLMLRAALMSPTSRGQRNWQFAVVTRKADIKRLSAAKDSGAQFLEKAPLAIVVMGDPSANDCWIEDGSIAAIAMQLQAEDLGLGSCWVQMRGRGLADGRTADAMAHGILGLPQNMEVLCVLGIGHPADVRKPQTEEHLKWENVIVQTDD